LGGKEEEGGCEMPTKRLSTKETLLLSERGEEGEGADNNEAEKDDPPALTWPRAPATRFPSPEYRLLVWRLLTAFKREM